MPHFRLAVPRLPRGGTSFSRPRLSIRLKDRFRVPWLRFANSSGWGSRMCRLLRHLPLGSLRNLDLAADRRNSRKLKADFPGLFGHLDPQCHCQMAKQVVRPGFVSRQDSKSGFVLGSFCNLMVARRRLQGVFQEANLGFVLCAFFENAQAVRSIYIVVY